MELFNDFDCEIHYNPGKANVVADALSRKEKSVQITSAQMVIVSQLPDLIRRDQKVAEKSNN